MYTKQELGLGLKKELSQGYNIFRISEWAYNVFSNNRKYLSPELEETLQYLFFMEEDPQFKYTELELKLLAEMLINNEENPIKKINEMKQER